MNKISQPYNVINMIVISTNKLQIQQLKQQQRIDNKTNISVMSGLSIASTTIDDASNLYKRGMELSEE